ncbi:SDR family oxidoreductase [Microbacterium sp. NPDC077644]|uniref:SDR family oxidoreductase n=1 Tax=Microbacterium sp. NPDC077644 TaxID=3155055 RepID=UPI00344BB7D5
MGVNYLNGRTALVTGAASGFGRLLASDLAELGVNVVGADLNEAALAETGAGIHASGGRFVGVVADVRDSQQMRDAVGVAISEFDGLDILINNAGVMPLSFFSDHESALGAWSNALDVNVKGVLNGIAAVFDHMIERGRGHVVNISSTYGKAGTEGSAVYSATKSAVETISESLRIEAQGRIKVTVVRPTGVKGTGLTSSILNTSAVAGMIGHHGAAYAAKAEEAEQEPHGELFDPESIRYWSLEPEHISHNILHAVNQPWGVCISDITIRASGEDYML